MKETKKTEAQLAAQPKIQFTDPLFSPALPLTPQWVEVDERNSSL